MAQRAGRGRKAAADHRPTGLMVPGCFVTILLLTILAALGGIRPPGSAPQDAHAEAEAARATLIPVRSVYDDLIVQAAAEHGVDPNLMRALIHWESNYDPAAVSKVGAQGLGQLMPGTAAELGVGDPFDPAQNIAGATALMARLLSRYGGQLELALAGYNAGANAVDRFQGVPPYAETQTFIKQVGALYQTYQTAGF